MVSLVKLSEVTEDGVKFQSPHDQSEMLLTPEKSIQIQNIIGRDRRIGLLVFFSIGRLMYFVKMRVIWFFSDIIDILFLYKKITKNIFRIIHRC
jgi:hypothetical protein